jgi:hypothetical protein
VRTRAHAHTHTHDTYTHTLTPTNDTHTQTHTHPQTHLGGSSSGPSKKELMVESYVPPDPGPYPEDKPRTNRVRFTPVQTEAIMSGEAE